MKRSSEKENELPRIPQFEPGADLLSPNRHPIWIYTGSGWCQAEIHSVKVKAQFLNTNWKQNQTGTQGLTCVNGNKGVIKIIFILFSGRLRRPTPVSEIGVKSHESS